MTVNRPATASPTVAGVPDGLPPAALTLARRFAAGATMWCVAPEWPAHGRHVAVEFVHPVIVGKRALPALHVENGDLDGALRLLSRPGDVLLGVGTLEEPRIAGVMARAAAWGLMRIWIGAGARPDRHVAEHLIWIEDLEPEHAARSGDIVLAYHLLWELTQVVFEHPGLLEDQPACGEEVCVTCSDEGLVAEVRGPVEAGYAEVVVAGHAERVDVSLVEPVLPGTLVLVHAGVALTTLEPSLGPADE